MMVVTAMVVAIRHILIDLDLFAVNFIRYSTMLWMWFDLYMFIRMFKYTCANQ